MKRFSYKKFFKNFAIVLSVLLLVAIIILFAFRTSILNSVINSKIADYHTTHGVDIKVTNAAFSGFNEISIDKINVSEIGKEKLAEVSGLKTSFKLLPLIVGHLNISNLEINSIELDVIKRKDYNNYSFLFKRKNKQDSDDNSKDYAYRYNKLFDVIFGLFPYKVNLSSLIINIEKNGKFAQLTVKNFNITDKNYRAKIKTTEDDNIYLWNVSGNIDKDNRNLSFKIYSAIGDSRVEMPKIFNNWKLKLEFDSLQFSINRNIIDNDILKVAGYLSFSGLIINHSRVSKTDVFLDRGSLTYSLNIGKDYYEIDSSTIVQYNKIQFNPYIKLQIDTSRKLTIVLNKKDFSAQDFFESFPKGLFTNLEGIQTEGNLSYCLRLFVDEKQPDSLQLFSELRKHNFKIIKQGETDLTKISRPFKYTVYENGSPVRSILVSEENLDFVPYDDIPESVKGAVLVSEDGAFMWHRGFIEESFRKAIAHDIKTKSFAKGASTITMQLVKNVFLNRNKTVTRKLEEAIIVWLIENNGLCSKKRMFEVYLNIIEWGPNVYGISEAASYYFNKRPAQLNLTESIFLARIIPMPKHYNWIFDEEGQLKDYVKNYYTDVSKKMLRREYISETDTVNLKPIIKLKGESQYQLLKKKFTNIDSLFNQLNDE